MAPKQKFFKNIKKNQKKLSVKEEKIADYLIHSYPDGLLDTASEIAEKLGVSISTVSRFFPKIGFRSIKEAQKDYKADFDYLKNSPLDRFHQKEGESEEGETLLERTMNFDISNIEETFKGISDADIREAIRLICREDNSLYIVGGRKMTGVSYYAAIQLATLHPDVTEVNTDPSLIADAIVNVGARDVLLLFDFRRYMKISRQLAGVFKENGGKVIVISDSPICPCADLADILFIIKTKGVSIFDSYTAGYFLINALVAGVTQQYGDKVKQKYEKLEAYYKRFDIFFRS